MKREPKRWLIRTRARRIIRGILLIVGVLMLVAVLPATTATKDARAADIGGAFELVDHTGRVTTDADFRGKYLLVFFGYTYCPDVCPTELAVMGQALDELGDTAEQIQPLFITVDPARDTVERLAEYVPVFHPRLIGLTGSVAQVARAAKAYRVYFREAPQESPEADYLMEHSAIVYLMSPAGEYVMHFVFGQGPEKMAELIRKRLQ